MKDYPSFAGYSSWDLRKTWLFYRKASRKNKQARSLALEAVLKLKARAIVIEFHKVTTLPQGNANQLAGDKALYSYLPQRQARAAIAEASA